MQGSFKANKRPSVWRTTLVLQEKDEQEHDQQNDDHDQEYRHEHRHLARTWLRGLWRWGGRRSRHGRRGGGIHRRRLRRWGWINARLRHGWHGRRNGRLITWHGGWWRSGGSLGRGRQAGRAGTAAHGQLPHPRGIEDACKLTGAGGAGRLGGLLAEAGRGRGGLHGGCGRRRSPGRSFWGRLGRLIGIREGSEGLRPSARLRTARRAHWRGLDARGGRLYRLVEHLNQPGNADTAPRRIAFSGLGRGQRGRSKWILVRRSG